jgi:two-component system, cell cycle response regulator
VHARVLILEDNLANLDLMLYLLGAFGHVPIPARNGREGLRIAAEEKPDLILCDIHLPKMDGYEVVRRLKSDPRCCSIPTVAVTALAMVGDRDRILRAGFDGYLAKPINPETFVQEINESLVSNRAPLLCRHAAQKSEVLQPFPKAAKILVVDNVPANLEFACATLKPSGYEVITSSGPREALEKAKQDRPDMIISDLCMSEGNGYDFIRAVKIDARLTRIPFVFLTSSMCEDEDRARGLALGAARFLIRPIEPQQLLSEIESCLIEDALSGTTTDGS